MNAASYLLAPRALSSWLRVATVVAAFMAAAAAEASNCSPRLPGVTAANASTESIKLVGVQGVNSDGVTRGTIDPAALTSAGSAWNSACSSYQNPTFSTSGGSMSVNVVFWAGSNDGTRGGSNCTNGGCGCSDVSVSNNRIVGATVHIFEQQVNGADCTGSYNGVLTHELGHVQGLDDPAANCNCSGSIMGNVGASISGTDCTVIDDNWTTDDEKPDPREDDGGGPCAV